MDSPRAVQLAAVIEAGRFDPGSLDLQLSLRRLTLYNDDLTQSLYEFPMPAASPRPAQNVVSRLLAPPPGVMPMRLPVLEGRLVLNRDEVRDEFLTLVALGQLPELLKEDREAKQAHRPVGDGHLYEDFLTPEAQPASSAGNNPGFAIGGRGKAKTSSRGTDPGKISSGIICQG